jgi:hypothetical protein
MLFQNLVAYGWRIMNHPGTFLPDPQNGLFLQKMAELGEFQYLTNGWSYEDG